MSSDPHDAEPRAARPDNRVAITGIGTGTPLGADLESTWRGIQDGGRACRRLEQADATGLWEQCERRGWSLSGAPAIPPAEWDPDREDVHHLAVAAARGAVLPCHEAWESTPPVRRGIVVGTSKGGMKMLNRSPRRGESPGSFLDLWPGTLSVDLARLWGARGPCVSPVAACATGLACVIRGAELIQSGTCDVVLAGSADASLTPSVFASFARLGVLATRGAPEHACRPFDSGRSGFLIGEGAAMFVLRPWSLALDRDEPIIAQWRGGRLASAPHDLTGIDPDSEDLAHLIRTTLHQCGLMPRDIDLVGAHGTGTPLNDLFEARSLKKVFGDHFDDLWTASIKGAIGHLLGAAGSVELAVLAMALRDQIVPPTVNCDRLDPACGVRIARDQGRSAPLRNGLKLSLGFGGHIAAGILSRVPT